MRLPILAAAIGLAALALPACEEGPASTIIDSRVGDAMQLLRYAATQGPVLVEVRGAPFAGQARWNPADLVAVVADAFRPVTNPPMEFTLDKAKAGDAGYRFVWLIDPGPGFGIDPTCAGQYPARATTKADFVEVRAVFCAPNKSLVAVQGRVRRPKAADDRLWDRLVRQMSRQLAGDRFQG